MIAGAVLHTALLTVLALFLGTLDGPSAAAIGSLGLWIVLEARAQTHTDRSQDGPSTLLGLSLFGVVVLSIAAPAPGTWWGLPVLWLGIVLRTVAMHTLASAFITAPRCPDDPVEHGIYAWVRHPSELGNLAIPIGVAWLGGSAAASLVVLGWILPLVLFRVHREDAWWLRRGSPRHQAYVRTHPAFIPRPRRS